MGFLTEQAESNQVIFDVDDCQQGQSLPLSEILKQYLLTGVAPCPHNSSFEFNDDLSDEQMSVFDGHRLDHDFSEIDVNNDSLSFLHEQLNSNAKNSSAASITVPEDVSSAVES